jgi:peptide alpha-N-acetyltransferase
MKYDCDVWLTYTEFCNIRLSHLYALFSQHFRSHVCWHVYGLLHRADRNYNEAIKAYKQALRIDPENLQILRDLSLLQIQMRDLHGFCLTRNTLLTLKPNAKVNWLSLALAKHLTGDVQGAIHVIDIYLGTLTEGSPELSRCFESSELALYRNSILAELPGDNYKEALNHLAACESVVVDRGAWLMMRATYQLKRGDFADAKETCLTMFARGLTEDYRVHSIFMCAVLQLKDNDDDEGNSKVCEDALELTGTSTLASMIVLPPDQRQLLKDIYLNDVAIRYPSSPAIHRIPMTLMEGDELRTTLGAYCRRGLAKGVPSLCSEMSSLFLREVNGRYQLAIDPVDVKAHAVYAILVDLADEYIVTLSQHHKFSSNGDDADEDPTMLLWAWYLRAGLHGMAGEYTEGITLLDQCLDHTPTAVDVYELKALLLKAAGDLQAAVDCLDKGRELDKQDRYINNQTTKYMLQAGMEEKALQRISLFTRHEGNPEQNLFDMQCSWYELELAECLERKGEWGRSLKKYCK